MRGSARVAAGLALLVALGGLAPPAAAATTAVLCESNQSKFCTTFQGADLPLRFRLTFDSPASTPSCTLAIDGVDTAECSKDSTSPVPGSNGTAWISWYARATRWRPTRGSRTT